MALDSTHIIKYLVETPTIREYEALMQTALTTAMTTVAAETGLIVFFEGESGQQAGPDGEIIARYLAALAMRTGPHPAITAKTRHNTTANLNSYANLEMHLPRVPTIVNAEPQRRETTRLSDTQPTLASLQKILLIPLIATDSTRLAGVIAILLPLYGIHALDPNDVRSLQLFSQTTANTWDIISALTQTRSRLDDAVLLHEVATVITSTHQLHTLLQRIMELTKQLLHVDACSLLLVDPNTNELVFQFAEGEAKESVRQMRLAPGVGISGYVAQTGDAVIVNDVAADSRFASNVDEATGFRTRCVMCAPLRVRNRMIGVIEVINKLDISPFTNNDLALLTSLAAQSAVAIENAQLYANLREERDRLLVKEDEVRRTLSRDLHDGPAQVVAGLAFRAEIILKTLDTDPEKARAYIVELQNSAQAVARDLRTLLFGLRPIMLEKRGFIATVTSYVERLKDEPWHIHYHVEGFDPPPTTDVGDNVDRTGPEAIDPTTNIPLNVENALFIMIQEAINNIKKHAYAYNVWLSINRNAKGVVIGVRDDGVGFDIEEVRNEAKIRGSFGLTNMEERARLIGSYYHLDTKVGLGTTTTIFYPTTTTTTFTEGAEITRPTPTNGQDKGGSQDTPSAHFGFNGTNLSPLNGLEDTLTSFNKLGKF